MKKSSIIFTIAVLLLQLYNVTSTCYELYPITFSATTLACSTNQVLTPTNFPNFPSAGTRKLLFAFTLEKGASCNGASTESYFMALYTKVAGTDTFIFGFKFDSSSISAYYNNDGNEQLLNTYNTAEPNARLGFWIDLDDSTATQIKIAGVIGDSYTADPYGFDGDLSAWLFDSNTKIYLNSASDGVTAYSVRFSELSVGYEMPVVYGSPEMARAVLDKVIPTPVAREIFASYDVSSLSGNTLPDSANKLGKAYLGESSSDSTNAPTVAATGGLSFTNIAQKITLPSTVYTGNLGTHFKYAMTVSFMIKLTAWGSSTTTIVSRKKSDETEIFSINLLSNNTIVPSYSGASFVPSMNAINPNIWTLVTVQIVAFDTGSGTRATTTISQWGGMVSIRTTPPDATQIIASPPTDAATDKFTIGGFTGLLQSFTLAYRGEGIPDPGSCTTNCLYVMGPYTPTCILKSCSTSQYRDGDLCTECSVPMPNCQACSQTVVYPSVQTTCSQCASGFLVKTDNSGCQPCSDFITKCSTCSSSSVCNTCSGGYVPVSDGTSCICPVGKYVTGSDCQFCSSQMPGCAKCPGASTCDQCTTGFIMKGDKSGCLACSSLIKSCAECTGDSKCTKCLPGFKLVGDVSCTCPNGMTDLGYACQFPAAEKSGLSGGIIVGVIIGAIALMVISTIVIMMYRKGKGFKSVSSSNTSIYSPSYSPSRGHLSP